MNLLRGTNQRVWGRKAPEGSRGRIWKTLENTNGAVAKIDL